MPYIYINKENKETMTKLEFTNKALINLNNSMSEDGKVELINFIEFTNKLYESIFFTRCSRCKLPFTLEEKEVNEHCNNCGQEMQEN